MIDKTKIKRRTRAKTKPISLRIPVEACKFMNKNDYSPTAIFMETLRELGYKDE